jgi:hypothetical protein
MGLVGALRLVATKAEQEAPWLICGGLDKGKGEATIGGPGPTTSHQTGHASLLAHGGGPIKYLPTIP